MSNVRIGGLEFTSPENHYRETTKPTYSKASQFSPKVDERTSTFVWIGRQLRTATSIAVLEKSYRNLLCCTNEDTQPADSDKPAFTYRSAG